MLDDLGKIKKLDQSKIADSIFLLGAQIEHSVEECKAINIPDDFSKIDHVVIHGMGGSNLGAKIIEKLYIEKIPVPLTVLFDYSMPESVNENTLYILSSYSGTTEEVLSVCRKVVEKKAKILIITEGGELGEFMKRNNIPGYIISPRFNPSKCPRIGLGYTVFGTIALLSSVGLINVDKDEIKAIVENLKEWDRELNLNKHSSMNQAKQIAKKIFGKQPMIVGAEHLVGNLHTFRNQFCETSKNFAHYLILPDINHFALEGLQFPAENKEFMIFIFVNSGLYHPRIRERSVLTKEVVSKNSIEIIEITLKGEDRLTQCFELLQLGSWVTFYLGMLNNVDPAKTPHVDWFKRELSKTPFWW